MSITNVKNTDIINVSSAAAKVLGKRFNDKQIKYKTVIF